jgi:hypothetical protein
LSNFTITNGNRGDGVEKVHVHLITKVAQTDPKLARIPPLQPRPSQS